MDRLRRSRYGFWPALDMALFQEMTRVGMLRAVRGFEFDKGKTYSTLFEVRAGS